MMKFLGVIPARYASTRFPGKPLVRLGEKTLIQWVYEKSSGYLEKVIVATDDHRIKEAVESFGGRAILTSDTHQSGTDRCAEVVRELSGSAENFDVIVNIQGDEPFIQQQHIVLLKDCFKDSKTQIATLVNPVVRKEDIFNPNVVKATVSRDGYAMYFSRSAIPFIRNSGEADWHKKYSFLKHMGIYAYRSSVLLELTKLEPSPLELAEMLEQNRWLENGFKIRVEKTDIESFGIDSPEDLKRAEKMI